ncbi:hypothetical protein RJ639_031548 [Escallonia herrerae]|uniref:URB1 C-terminal domain-containing protein n=1 Tax=Escallonia herrerae TaxID=1293975 RepID=A0AA88XE00_9ASTE|nr:hypothetical protein RJ639_031548 [Escallonia herrerae]
MKKCQKRKDVTRLRLLLTYLQNGIEEPWQKIPSISALFVAEASFILLDPSHDHYMTISKLLVRSPRMNMKSIPMFHEFFWSSSVDFKTERLWILRLLYAGLNLDDDAHIYIRNSVFEILLSFYASPLSDNESKELILQNCPVLVYWLAFFVVELFVFVENSQGHHKGPELEKQIPLLGSASLQTVRKSIKLHKMALYLVEHCGLISWLSSVVSSFCGRKHQYERSFSSTQLNVVLEVVNYVISSRHTSEWLQKCALEQLTELSSHLYKFLAGGIKLIKEVPLVNSIIAILTSTLKISLEREVFQPHFTLSVEGLYQICQVIDVCSDGTYCPDAALGLKAVLMSTPPAVIFCMDREKLLKFILWATSTALRSNSTEVSYHHFTLLEEEQSEDSLISKLLRWLTASVILGQLPRKLNRLDSNCSLERESAKTLRSLLHLNERWSVEKQVGFGSVKILADTIFYLHQLLGWNYRMLPSVISALCLLLLSDPSFSESNIGHGNLASLISRIRCPAEANPAWRWSYYQPWKDHSCELTDAEKLDEIQACQSLLLIISDILGKNSLHLPLLSYHDVESSGVFEWERSILETEC